MARVDLRNQANAAGDWFVDTRCIDCGTCRDIAPDLFTGRAVPGSTQVTQGTNTSSQSFSSMRATTPFSTNGSSATNSSAAARVRKMAMDPSA